MKKILLNLIILIAIFSFTTIAQNPSYETKLMNGALVAPNEYEFDIYIKRTGSVAFEAYGLQVALIFDDTIKNGGTLTSTYISGSSTMNTDQIPSNPNVATLVGTKRVWKLAGKIPTGGISGGGTIISNEGNGTRLGRFKITTSAVLFGSAIPNLTWIFDQTTYGYATKFTAKVGGQPIDITSANIANHTILLYPTYESKLMNGALVAPNQYEFDIFVKSTGILPMEAYGLQVCLIFDDAIRNAGTLTATYIAGSSTMNADQTPSNPNVATLVGTKRVWKLAGKIPTGGLSGTGTTISTKGDGTRLGRFRISTSAKSFSPVPANLTWNFSGTPYGYATKFLVFSEERMTLPDITSINQANYLNLLPNQPLSVRK